MVPARWSVVAHDSQAVLIATTNANAIGPSAGPNADPQVTELWRYCLRSNGRFRKLAASTIAAGGLGDIIHVYGVVVAGDYVAYHTLTTTSGGRDYGANIGTVYLKNLRTGKVRTKNLYTECDVPSLLVTLTGTAVWQANACAQPGAPQFVAVQALIQSLDTAGHSVTLDSATPIMPSDRPLANLAVYRCVAGCSPSGAFIAWWTHNGAWRSAKIS